MLAFFDAVADGVFAAAAGVVGDEKIAIGEKLALASQAYVVLRAHNERNS